MTEFTVDRPFVILVAAVLAAVVSYASARLAMHSDAFLDNPNERSSHEHAISRTGGLAMLAALVTGLFTVAVFGASGAAGAMWKFMLLALLAGGVGLADDYLNLRPLVKFAGQFFVSLLFVWLLGPLQTMPAPFVGVINLGALGVFITIVWIVAFMNVFNFMDGVNGIAAGAAAVGLSAFALIAGLTGAPMAGVIAFIVAVAAAGFLPANVLRGRLFMGDCGSHMLAFMIAGLGVFAVNESASGANALIMPVIFLPFILDVAFTLAHRIIRKQNILSAHREHIYQVILRRGASHGSVAAVYSGLIALCAGAAVIMLALSPQWMWIAPVLIAVGLLAVASIAFRDAKKRGLLA